MKLLIFFFSVSLTCYNIIFFFFCNTSKSKWLPGCEQGAVKTLDHFNTPPQQPQQDEALLHFAVFIFCPHTAFSNCVSYCFFSLLPTSQGEERGMSYAASESARWSLFHYPRPASDRKCGTEDGCLGLLEDFEGLIIHCLDLSVDIGSVFHSHLCLN